MGNGMKTEKKNLVLIGFMGSGKTTLGLKLSYRLKMPVEDTDKLIERREKKSIRQIFDGEGEGYFRACETALLRELAQKQTNPKIYSVGGGTPLSPDNRPLLRQLGTVVWLRVQPDTVYGRLKGDTGRPLLQCEDPLGRIRELTEQRREAYAACADITVDVDGKSTEEILRQILDALGITEESAPSIGGEVSF